MDFLLNLKFENAGIFRSKFYEKGNEKYWDENGMSKDGDDRIYSDLKKGDGEDVVISRGDRSARHKSQWIDQGIETIDHSFIANVLRVMSGARPMPKYRPSCIKSDAVFEELAKSSKVKIHSLIITNKDGTSHFVYETQNTNKCLSNSWDKCNSSWLRIKHLVSESVYSEVLKTCKKYINDPESILIQDALSMLDKDEIQYVGNLAKEDKSMSLYHMVNNGVQSLCQDGYNGLGVYLKNMVTKGVVRVTRIDGNIAIPLKKNQLSLFSAGSGFATILEGGLVSIESLVDLSFENFDYLTSGYKAVGGLNGTV